MNLKSLTIAAIGLALFFAGCTETSKNSDTASDKIAVTQQNFSSITGKAWVLESMISDGQTYELIGKKPTVKIQAAGKITGFASLNMFFGTMQVDNSGTIKWPPALGSTRMAGKPELMKQENAFLAALPKTQKVSIEREKLVMVSVDVKNKLVFAISTPN